MSNYDGVMEVEGKISLIPDSLVHSMKKKIDYAFYFFSFTCLPFSVPCLPRLVEGKKGVKVENRPFLSKLIFFNVSEHDYGNYTCVASNKLGHTNASIMLFGETLHGDGQQVNVRWERVDGGKEGIEEKHQK